MNEEPANVSKHVWVCYICVILLYFIVFAFWQVEMVPIEVHSFSAVLFAICTFPMARWYACRDKGLPMFELVCLAYGLQFSTPLYFQFNQIVIFSQIVPLQWNSVLGVLALSIIGVMSMVASYYLFTNSRTLGNSPRIDLPLEARRKYQYSFVSIVLGLGVVALQLTNLAPPGQGPLGAIMRLLAGQLNLAIIVLAYQVHGRGSASIVLPILLHFVVAAAAGLGLASGLLENALIPLALVFIVKWHATQRFPWRYMLVGLFLFVILNPVKAEYRNQTWFSGTNVSIVQRIGLWFELGQTAVTDLVEGDVRAGSEAVLAQSSSRLDLLHKFAWVYEMTPSYVPYFQGSTYNYLIYGWIPRFIWPGKPVASDATRTLDVSYQLVYKRQTGTNIGIGHMPEAYANFGVIGIVVFMALQGGIFAWLAHLLNGPGSEGGRAIYMIIMVVFLNGIGSSTAVLFGAILQIIVANAIILRPFATDFQAKQLLPTASEFESVLQTPGELPQRLPRLYTKDKL